MAGQETLVHEKLWGAVKLEIHRFNGKNGDFLKAKIARIYTDSEGKWKDTNFFSGKDLEGVAQASAEANNYILQNPMPGAKPVA